MVRGSGKFKQKRGGGRHFSRNMTINDEGVLQGERKAGDEEEEGEDEDEDEEDEDESGEEEEEEEEEEKPELTRAQRKELKKKKDDAIQEEEEDPDLINPNHVTKKVTIADLDSPRELTRREREQKEKQEAKDKYWKLHAQGKTQEAKADLARLAKIREEREAAQARRKAETEAKAAEIEARKTKRR